MEYFGLTIDAWITVVTILGLFLILLTTRIPADVAFVGAMTILLVTNVLTIPEALGGFSSSSVVTVGVLFIVVSGLAYTGVIQLIAKYLLGKPKNYPSAIVRLMLPVAAMSAFLSNTTVVALFIRVVKVWAKKLSIAPSKLLIPLTYASGMGGVCTLIGTPPNLLISGFYTGTTGEQLNIFVTALPGLFCLAIGVLSMLAMRKLLPERKSPEEAFANTTGYTAELLVPTDNEFVGQTISEAGLSEVKGGRLIEIVRFDKEIISPVADDEFILGGDRLVFSGRIEDILKLRDDYGFANASHHVFSLDDMDKNRKLATASLPEGSSLIGSRMCETDFEDKNGLVLVAVSRMGERIEGSPRDIQLRFGDTLLLEYPKSMPKSSLTNTDINVFESEDIPDTGIKTFISSAIMIAMVLLSAFNVMPLLHSCFLAAFAMIITHCISLKVARASVNWFILMVFAGSVCLGTAIDKSGLAVKIADGLMSVCGDNPYVILVCICVLGTFLTEFVSNTACAAILYPIAYSSALALGVNPLSFCIALMIAVSSSFATPIGSPTHMLVYGPGGYRFSDFLKVGLPMNLIVLAANIFIVLLLYPL